METFSKEFDTFYQIALDEATRTGQTSVAEIMRAFKLSHGTATSLLNKMLEAGVITPKANDELTFVPVSDALYAEVKVWVEHKELVSLTDIQREFKLSWSRAKRLLLSLECKGVLAGGELDQKRAVQAKT